VREFLEEIVVVPDYLDMEVRGAPPVHVLYREVGLKASDRGGVGGGTLTTNPPPPIWAIEAAA